MKNEEINTAFWEKTNEITVTNMTRHDKFRKIQEWNI